MDINLLTDAMLGHWRIPSGAWQCEFQFGRRLIYVQHHDHELPHARLAAAQRVIQAVWDDLPQALTFAEQRCKARMPELMRVFKAHLPGQSPLFVYSIHFDLDNPLPGYTISRNPDFDWDRRLTVEDDSGQKRLVCMAHHEPADDFWVHVRRVGLEQFEFEDQPGCTP